MTGIRKSFGGTSVLRDVSLEVREGEVVALIGGSGAGKSTLLRIINQLDRQDHGSVEVGGEAIASGLSDWKLAHLRARIGIVFQSFNLWHHLSVLDNVTLAPRIVRKLTRSAAEDEALTLLHSVGLAEHVAKYPGQLSGGQKQRVAIARALAMRPQLMLFDEATSALDPALAGEVLDVMAALAARGMTMIVVTHEMRFARRVSSRTAFMADGRIVEDRPTPEFFAAPRTPQAEAFLSRGFS